MKKILSLCMTCVLTTSLITGCESKKEEGNIVNVSILNSKPEITLALEKIVDLFEKENEDIRIKIVQYSQSGSYRDKLNSMNEADNAPTLTLVDSADIEKFSDICLNLSDQSWVKEVSGGITDIANNKNNEVIAFPFSTEGAGFIYNKKLIDEAGIDVSSINTISELEDAFKAINKINKDALIITNEEWSLGDHFLSTFYASDIKESGLSSLEYFENIKNSPDYISQNKTLNGLLDTFDIMKKYNMYSDSPLTPSYEKCSEILGSGKVGFWYMGNWASKNILEQSNGNNEFGFIPVPISNDESDWGNNEIAVGITKYFIVNKNSSDNQIEAVKKFLNYIVYNAEGNKFLSEECGVIPAFKNIEVPDVDPLVNDILKYKNEDKTVELMNSYLPSNNSAVLGNALRKYLNNEITRDRFINEVEEFWKNS